MTARAARHLSLFAATVAAFAVMPSSAGAETYGSRTLSVGTRGSDVVQLQRYLSLAGHRIVRDGEFGSRTARALRATERNLELDADGIATRREQRAIRRAVRRPGNGGSAYAQPPPPAETVVVPGATGQVSADGFAVAPESAPPLVKSVIAAGNAIAQTPYKWGGGHASWTDTGYDCSGSVSYALYGGGLFDEPARVGRVRRLGRAGPRPVDHDLRERQPCLHGGGGAPVRHERPLSDRLALDDDDAKLHRLRRHAPRGPLARAPGQGNVQSDGLTSSGYARAVVHGSRGRGLSMRVIDRRAFLRRAGLSTAALATLGGPLQGLFARGALAVGSTGVAPDNGGYGPIGPVRDLTDDVVRLHLPEGFEYRSITPTGTLMDDGVITPGRHDGMTAFAWGKSRYRLVRNHEINNPVGAFGTTSKAYDTMAGAGTTTVEVNRHAAKVESWVSSNGMQMTCAGGRTPWGTWLTVEETVNGPDVGPDFTGADNRLLNQRHGYVFEVPVDWGPGEYAKLAPVRSAGRFAHEAVDIDPQTGILYETEDNFTFPSGFYRYIAPQNPMQVRELRDGGRLEMLKVEGVTNAQLDRGQTPGVTYGIEWVPIDTPDTTFAAGTTNDQASVFVSNQGIAQGAATFSRLEGIFFDSGKVYLVSTQGGDTPRARRLRSTATATASVSSGCTTRRTTRSRCCSSRPAARCWSCRTTSASARRSRRSCARTARPRTTCAASRPRAASSTSRSTP